MPSPTHDDDLILGRRAIERGLITKEGLQAALDNVVRSDGQTLGEVLEAMGLVTVAELGTLIEDRPAAAAKPLPADVQTAHEDLENRVGKYILLDELGRGGMGVVRKAWDTLLERHVAIKCLLRQDDARLRQRLLREAQTAARLSHAHIVPIHEVLEHDGGLYVVMELVEGYTIDCARPKLRAAVEIMRDVCGALHYAHERGIIHRDIKPGNLMIDSSRRVRVMDFGIARSVEPGATITGTNVIQGTPAFMSPEQARGVRCDHRTDVYSIGATFYDLLTGDPPFEGGTYLEMLRQIERHEPASPRRRNPAISRDLETIVLTCLEKEPDKRYATAQLLADDLDRWLKDEPIAARRPSWPSIAMRRLRRRALAVSITFGLVVAALAITLWIRERAMRNRAGEEHAKSERALKELNALSTQILLEKQGLYRAASDPAAVRANLASQLDQISRFLERNPGFPQGHYVRATCRMYLDDLEGAEQDARAALAIDPAFTPGRLLLARIRLEQYLTTFDGEYHGLKKRVTAAAPVLEEATTHLSQVPEIAKTQDSAAGWGLARTRDDDVTENVARALAKRFLRNDPAGARELLLGMDQREPAEEYAYLLGLLATHSDEAIRWFSRAIELRPHFAMAFVSRAQQYNYRDECDRAIAESDAALRITPNLAAAYFQRAKAHRTLKKWDDSIRDYTRTIELSPENALAYGERAIAYSFKGDLAAAISDYDSGLAINPNLPALRMNRGNAKAGLRDLPGAIADYDRAIQLNPKLTMAYYNRGSAKYDLRDLPGAVADFDRAVQLNPKYAEAYTSRGNAKRILRDLSGAIADYDRAIQLDPELAMAYYNRGSAKCDLRDFPGAVADFDRAIQLNPNYVEAYFNRGNAKRILRDLPGAVADYEQALRIAPQDWSYRAMTEANLRTAREKLAPR